MPVGPSRSIAKGAKGIRLHQKFNGTLPTDPKVVRAIRYSGLGVRSVGAVGDFLERYHQRMAKLNMSKRQDGIREIHYRDSAKQGENQHLRSEKELPKNIPQQKQQVDWYHGNHENMLKTFIFWGVILLYWWWFRNPAPVLTANRISERIHLNETAKNIRICQYIC